PATQPIVDQKPSLLVISWIETDGPHLASRQSLVFRDHPLGVAFEKGFLVRGTGIEFKDGDPFRCSDPEFTLARDPVQRLDKIVQKVTVAVPVLPGDFRPVRLVTALQARQADALVRTENHKPLVGIATRKRQGGLDEGARNAREARGR